MASSDYFIINSLFKPFSYNELMAPVLMANLEFYNIQDLLGQLDAQASVWEGLLNELTDREVYNLYLNYTNDLRREADTLILKGLTPLSRRSLAKMRARYSSDIIPIELAYSRRWVLLDELRKAILLNPSLIYDRDASAIRLKELIDNPTLLPRSVSGALLTQLVALLVAPLAKLIIEDIREGGAKANEWRSILGNLYYEKVYRTGFEPSDIEAAMRGEGPKVLVDAVQNAVKSSGISGWDNIDALNLAYWYANLGLYSAIGLTDYKTLQNRGWDLSADLQRMRARYGDNAPTGTPPNPIITTLIGSSPADLLKQEAIVKSLELLPQLNSITDSEGNITLDFDISNKVIELEELYNKEIEELKLLRDELSKRGFNTQPFDIAIASKTLERDSINNKAAKLLKEAYNNYSYLFPNNPKAAIQVGLTLEHVNSNELVLYNYVPIEDPNNMKLFIGSIFTLVSNSESTPKLRRLEPNSKGKLAITENTVSKEDALKILKDAKLEKSYSYPQGEGGMLTVTTEDGKTEYYRIEGVPSIANTNNIIKKTLEFLTDFKGSKNTVNVLADITNEDDLNTLYLKYSHPIVKQNSNIRGTVVTTPEGDIQKIVMVPTDLGILVYSSSLNDFIYNNRIQYNNTLRNFILSPHIRQFTEFLPAKITRETIKFN